MSSYEQPEQQPTPSTADSTEPAESLIGEDTLSVHRSPRYTNFMVLGAGLGVLVALVLTTTFPENPEFTKVQVFGFLLLVCLAGGVLLGCILALILDRIIGRRAYTVVADRLGTDDVRAPAPPESTDTQTFIEKSE
ncbi:hypothetical protein [Cryobacterium sp. CG_9.6]|uniref:hypothetical protein n=1 Tax=Cryobacterium sp. CG_9.6 TaxID=2760710 RepID=UPI002475C70E|nr:hypothetical protein [Cryobacterium sp. CG_9.6]MDH6238339.1 hypothetical protein [Cryobacterium sp. CG_9.6]